jgi:hypothetical protein
MRSRGYLVYVSRATMRMVCSYANGHACSSAFYDGLFSRPGWTIEELMLLRLRVEAMLPPFMLRRRGDQIQPSSRRGVALLRFADTEVYALLKALDRRIRGGNSFGR